MTTTTSYSYTTFGSLEQFYALFVNPTVVIQFYQYGYPITFLLGFLGNIASLLTFFRPSLRKVSTGCLFIALAISDLCYLFICIFDFLEFGLKVSQDMFISSSSIDFLCSHRFHSMVELLTVNFVDFVLL